MAVTLVIWVGIYFYLWRIERRVREFERGE
jgi:CcmD family protein